MCKPNLLVATLDKAHQEHVVESSLDVVGVITLHVKVGVCVFDNAKLYEG